jgi:acetyl esterase
MCSRVSKALDGCIRLLLFIVIILLFPGIGALQSAAARVGWPAADPRKNLRTSQSTPEGAIDPQVKAVHEKMSAAGIGPPDSVEDVRKAYLFYAKLSGAPEHVFRVENREIPGPKGNLAIRVYTPNSETALPILIFFHGGGFVAGSLDTYDSPLRAITNRCACIVVSVAYRLAPQNKYPAARDDAYAATKWVAEQASTLGGDARRIAVGGDGAGGNLAAVVTLMARERGTPHLTFQVLIYPMLEASTLRPSWFTETDAPTVTREAKRSVLGAYLPVAIDLGDPYISPLRTDNLANLPPVLMIVYGGDDPMRAEGEDYAHRLTHDGVPVKLSVYPQAIHGFFLMAGDLDAGKKCIDEIAGALKSAFAGSSKSGG